MDNWHWTKGKREELQTEPTTFSRTRSGDFPPGSLESRATARSMIQQRQNRPVKVIRFVTDIDRPPRKVDFYIFRNRRDVEL